MMGQVGAALAPLVTGIVLDSYGWSTVFAGLSIASLIGFVVRYGRRDDLRSWSGWRQASLRDWRTRDPPIGN